jgi:hypothetical protein
VVFVEKERGGEEKRIIPDNQWMIAGRRLFETELYIRIRIITPKM